MSNSTSISQAWRANDHESVLDLSNDMSISLNTSINSIRPVSIKQLLKATRAHSEAYFTIEDKEIDRVSVVAMLTERHGSITRLNLVLEDGSGVIRCVYWREALTPQDVDALRERTYIRAVGRASVFRDEIQLRVLAIVNISDPLEIFFHPLDVIVATLHYERGPPNGGAKIKTSSVNHFTDAITPSSVEQSTTKKAVDDDAESSRTYNLSVLQRSLPLEASPDRPSFSGRGNVHGPLWQEPSNESPASTSVPALTSSTVPRSQERTNDVQYPRRDPLSNLSLMERAILVYIQNNQKFYSEGVPLALIARSVAKPNREDLNSAIRNLIEQQHIASNAEGKKFHTIFYASSIQGDAPGMHL